MPWRTQEGDLILTQGRIGMVLGRVGLQLLIIKANSNHEAVVEEFGGIIPPITYCGLEIGPEYSLGRSARVTVSQRGNRPDSRADDAYV